MFKVWRIINLIDIDADVSMVVDNLWIGAGARSSDEIKGDSFSSTTKNVQVGANKSGCNIQTFLQNRLSGMWGLGSRKGLCSLDLIEYFIYKIALRNGYL